MPNHHSHGNISKIALNFSKRLPIPPNGHPASENIGINPSSIANDQLSHIRLPPSPLCAQRAQQFVLRSLALPSAELWRSLFHALSLEYCNRSPVVFSDLVRVLLAIDAVDLNYAKSRWSKFSPESIQAIDQKIKSLPEQNYGTSSKKRELLLTRLDTIASVEPEMDWELSPDILSNWFKYQGITKEDPQIFHKFLALSALYHPSDLQFDSKSIRNNSLGEKLPPALQIWEHLSTMPHYSQLLHQRYFEFDEIK